MIGPILIQFSIDDLTWNVNAIAISRIRDDSAQK